MQPNNSFSFIDIVNIGFEHLAVDVVNENENTFYYKYPQNHCVYHSVIHHSLFLLILNLSRTGVIVAHGPEYILAYFLHDQIRERP